MLTKKTSNIKKVVLILLIISTTNLFSVNLKDIEILVSKINNSKKTANKKKLLNKLRIDIDTLNQRDYYEAQINPLYVCNSTSIFFLACVWS